MGRQATDIRGLLKEALASMEEENSNREQDVHGLECGNCDAGVPLPHSLGCRIRNALGGHCAECGTWLDDGEDVLCRPCASEARAPDELEAQ